MGKGTIGARLGAQIGQLTQNAAPAAKLDAPTGSKGERKGKIDPTRLRGGKQSLDWGEATEWLNTKAPRETVEKVKALASGHNLYAWQVVVEAIECFERQHGPRTGEKPKAANSK